MSTAEILIKGHGERPFGDVLIEKAFPIHLTPLEFLKFQLKYIIRTVLSEGEITLLAYIYLYGDKYAERFISAGESRSRKSIENYVGKLKKIGILTKGCRLHPDLVLTTDPSSFIYIFETDAPA